MRMSTQQISTDRAWVVFAAMSLLMVLAGCSSFVFIEDRLDPPSPTTTGITFQYKAPAARQVNVAGEFNNWMGTANGSRLDPNIDPMSDLDGDGTVSSGDLAIMKSMFFRSPGPSAIAP